MLWYFEHHCFLHHLECCCVYCGRVQCKGCPLKFDDKVTLQQVIDKAGITMQPNFFYEDNRAPQQPVNQSKSKTPQKSKRK